MADFIATRPQTHPDPRERLGIVPGGRQTRPLPARGFIRFRAISDPTIGLVAELDGEIIPIAGGARHDITPRQGRESITSYAGRDPIALQIPLCFDRDATRGSIEPELGMLDDLCGLDRKPPRIIIEGFGVPHGNQRDTAARWELDGTPAWGDDIRHRQSDGHRTYAQVTITAQRINVPSTLTEPNEAILVVVRDHYTVPKNGHPRSLKGIAKKYRTSWKALRKLNPKLGGDPDVGLPAGTKVRVY